MKNFENTYLTLVKRSEGVYTEKGSKFIGIAFPIETETDFKNQLKEIQRKYKGARHYCYAFIIGYGNSIIQRYNDDGEPSGTAGKPILYQLISSNITNAGIVVVRYFGGILLGTAGLTRAYRQAAQEAIKLSEIRTIEKSTCIQIICNYPAYIALMPVIKKHRGSIQQYTASEEIQLTVSIPQSELKEFENELNFLKKIHKQLTIH